MDKATLLPELVDALDTADTWVQAKSVLEKLPKYDDLSVNDQNLLFTKLLKVSEWGLKSPWEKIQQVMGTHALPPQKQNDVLAVARKLDIPELEMIAIAKQFAGTKTFTRYKKLIEKIFSHRHSGNAAAIDDFLIRSYEKTSPLEKRWMRRVIKPGIDEGLLSNPTPKLLAYEIDGVPLAGSHHVQTQIAESSPVILPNIPATSPSKTSGPALPPPGLTEFLAGKKA